MGMTVKMAVIATGRYSGKQPALTALVAAFSTVGRRPRGDMSPTDRLQGRPTRGIDEGPHPPGGRRGDGEAVAPSGLLS